MTKQQFHKIENANAERASYAAIMWNVVLTALIIAFAALMLAPVDAWRW